MPLHDLLVSRRRWFVPIRTYSTPLVIAIAISGFFWGKSFSVVTTFLLALLSNIDVLLAKHYLPGEIAGHYGALSTAGKMLLYAAGAFVTVLLPLASEAHERGKGGARVLSLSLGIIAAGSLLAWGLFSFYPELVISLLFGERYLDVAPYLGFFTIGVAAVALSLALINYFVAVRNTSFLYLLAFGIALEVGLVVRGHENLATVVQMIVTGSVILCILMVSNFLFLPKR